MGNCGIYKITNKQSGKSYIGQSTNIEKRWKNHKIAAFDLNHAGYNYPLYRAFRKYGIASFDFEILECCDPDNQNEAEIKWIAYYKSFEKGYNQDKGGTNSTHYNKLSDELVKLIIFDLKHSTQSSEDIGDKYGVSGRTIRTINSGEGYRQGSETYPIRKPLWELTSKHCKSCEICGKPTPTKFCSSKCSHIAQQRIQRPDKNELLHMIANSSFKQVGQLYNVSDNTIKKWCKAYGLPLYKKELVALWKNQ